ncbi:MAG: radical SAM protein [Acidobacteriota bacterium]
MTRRTVLLYNPKAPYYAMPLALLAIASELAAKGFAPVIVDARIDPDPLRTISASAGEALYLGLTVLIGAPLADAIDLCRRVRQRWPALPIVWGGWHPSIFPALCVDEGPVDAAIVAQGEEAAVAVGERLAAGADLSGIPGVARRGAPAEPRAFRPPDTFAPHDYGLLPLAEYFQRKGQRQLEYVASQGCPFACGFCSDPMVFKRRWAGLSVERVVGELARLTTDHGITDVGFQDEIYFVDPRRSIAISEGFLTRGLRFTWTATARVEEILRFGPDGLDLFRRSGLRKLIIGAESGEPEVLARIRKGIEADQILEAAVALDDAGIAGHFNFIVGFPFDEAPEEVTTTLRTIDALVTKTRLHEFALFYYAPYPGSPIFDEMAARRAAELPRTLEAWGRFDYVRRPGSWMSPASFKAVEDFKFYRGLAPRARGILRPLAALASLRNRSGVYALPVERVLGNFVRRRVLGHADL